MNKLTLEKSTRGFLKGFFGGEKVISVSLPDEGLLIETNKESAVTIPFSHIKKITPQGFLEPDPTMIFVTVVTDQKKYSFELPKDKRDTHLLLEHFSAWQLGEAFPENLEKLTLNLGHTLNSVSLTILGDTFTMTSKEGSVTHAMADLKNFSLNKSCYIYQATFKGCKTKYMVSQDYADNILSAIKVMNAWLRRNQA